MRPLRYLVTDSLTAEFCAKDCSIRTFVHSNEKHLPAAPNCEKLDRETRYSDKLVSRGERVRLPGSIRQDFDFRIRLTSGKIQLFGSFLESRIDSSWLCPDSGCLPIT